jgi:hypothetical protein
MKKKASNKVKFPKPKVKISFNPKATAVAKLVKTVKG